MVYPSTISFSGASNTTRTSTRLYLFVCFRPNWQSWTHSEKATLALGQRKKTGCLVTVKFLRRTKANVDIFPIDLFSFPHPKNISSTQRPLRSLGRISVGFRCRVFRRRIFVSYSLHAWVQKQSVYKQYDHSESRDRAAPLKGRGV